MSADVPPPPGEEYPSGPPVPPPPTGGDALPARGIGEILGAAFDIYRRNASQLIAIVAIVVVPLAVVEFLIARVAFAAKTHQVILFGRTVKVVEPRGFFVSLLALLTVAAIGVIMAAILQAALLRAAAEATIGDPADVRASYRWGLERFASVLLVSFLVGIAVLVGFLLLIIPGIIFLVMFSASVPAVVVEGAHGTEAMRRSWNLVKGHFWHVFGVILVAAIITGVISGLIGSIGGNTVVGLIFDIIGRVITAPFSALVTVVLYLDLRARSENLTVSRLRQEIGSAS